MGATMTMTAFLKLSISLRERLMLSSSCALTLVALIGGFGLSAWPSLIAYAWYPLLPFILPPAAYNLKVWLTNNKPFTVVSTLTAFVYVAPLRISDASSQIAMDSLFQRLSQKVAEFESEQSRQNTVVMPFTDRGAFEIGNTLRSALQDYGRTHALSLGNPRIANGLRCYEPFRLADSSEVLAPSYTPHPGIECTILHTDQRWEVCPIQPGDLLLAPGGDVPLRSLNYRGLSIFSKGASDWVGWLGQLKLNSVFSIACRIPGGWGYPQHLSWVAYKVQASPHLSLPVVDDGWVMQGGKIYCDSTALGHRLIFWTRASHRLRALKVSSPGENDVVYAVDNNHYSKFDIKLKSSCLELRSGAPHDDALFLIKNVVYQ
jgi:hypothetical protein